MEPYNIKVIKGGESLRITPVEVYKNPSLNRLRTYNAAEFSPMNLDGINWTGDFFVVRRHGDIRLLYKTFKLWKFPTVLWVIESIYTLLRRVWFSYLPRVAEVFSQVIKIFKDYYKTPRLILPILRIRLQLLNFVWCKTVHNNFSVTAHEQLWVDDPDGLTEDATLIPSQKLLAQWYAEYANRLKESEYEADRELYKQIQEFKHSLDDEVEIMYIAELDT